MSKLRTILATVLYLAILVLPFMALWLPIPAHSQVNTITCQNAAVYGASTNGSTQLITAKINGATYICGFQLWAAGTAAVKLIYGTGTACATGATDITPAYSLITQTGVADTSSIFRGLFAPAGNNVCINTSAGVAVQAQVFFIQR